MWIISLFKYLAMLVSAAENAIKVYKFADKIDLWTRMKAFTAKQVAKLRKKK